MAVGTAVEMDLGRMTETADIGGEKYRRHPSTRRQCSLRRWYSYTFHTAGNYYLLLLPPKTTDAERTIPSSASRVSNLVDEAVVRITLRVPQLKGEVAREVFLEPGAEVARYCARSCGV